MQEILQKQGMIGGKQMRFRCRKTPEQLAVYVQSGGASPTLQSRTVTPSSSQQTIYPQSGYDALSSVVINGDNNLVSGNIKSGVSIFGVNGNYSANLIGTEELSVSGVYKNRTLTFNSNSISFTPSCLIASHRYALGVSSSDTDYFVSSITCFKNPKFCQLTYMFYVESPGDITTFSEIMDSTKISKIMSITWTSTGVTVTFNSNQNYFFSDGYRFILLGS